MAKSYSAGSFNRQWKRFFEGHFEAKTLYNSSVSDDLKLFFAAFEIQPADLQGRLVLDAGCGSGRLSAALAVLGAQVVALDLADSVMLAARHYRHPRLSYVQASIQRAPIRTRAFDFVWSAGVLHHIGETESCFRALARMVKPGGKLAVWLYSSERFSPFLAARRMLPFVHLLPDRVQYAMCTVLSVPLVLAGPLAPVIGRKPRAVTWESFATARFGLYDALTPRYVRRYRFGTVQNWFVTNGFTEIKRWSELGVSGRLVHT